MVSQHCLEKTLQPFLKRLKSIGSFRNTTVSMSLKINANSTKTAKGKISVRFLHLSAKSGVRCVITATHIVKILNPEAIIVTNLTKLHSSATAVIKKPTAVWIRPITELLPLTDNIKPYLLNQEMELIYHRKDLKALTVLFLHSLCRDSPHI